MTEEARRPLRSRQTRAAHALAAALVRMGATPNAISAVSVLFALAGGVCLAFASPASPLRSVLLVAGAAAIQLRLLCNLMDGMVAIEGGRRTKSGEVWNDVPDRLADPLLLVLPAYAIPLPYAIDVGWCAALFAVLTAYVRWLGVGLRLPPDFGGPMAKPHRMFVLTLGALLSLVEPWLGLGGHALYGALAIIALGSLVTTARRAHHIARTLERAP